MKNIDEKIKKSTLYGKIINEFQAIPQDPIRREILKKIEEADGTNKRIFSYIANFNIQGSEIANQDIAAIGDILCSMGNVDYLDLIINSPGGDATVADKIVNLCRGHTLKEFRVVVPNRAKSAATLIALGADKIVMGISSELGPIDPQIPINISGFLQFISAHDFINALDEILAKIDESKKKNENTDHLLVMLSTFNLPFIEKCKREISYISEIAQKYLTNHMLKKYSDPEERRRIAKIITDSLTSTAIQKSHAKIIDFKAIKDLDIKLEIEYLEETTNLWKLIWEYYIRSEFILTYRKKPTALKLIETSESTLMLQEQS
jgi:hypothetical protein